VAADAERLLFAPGAFQVAVVPDGLHHLPDAYRGVREMLRVCSTAAVIVEPADAPLTRLALKVGLTGDYLR